MQFVRRSRPAGRRPVTAVAAAIMVVLGVSGVARADAIVNAIDATPDVQRENLAVAAGSTTTVGMYLIPSTGDGGSPGCNVGTTADTLAVVLTIQNLPTGVTATPMTVQACGIANAARSTITVAPDVLPGTYVVNSFTATNIGGAIGTYLTNGATAFFNLVVTPRLDSTPPVIEPTIKGTTGANGWYTSDVTVSWSVTDPESTVTATGCSPTVLTADSTGSTLTCSATSAGGSSSSSVTVAIDQDAPTITASIDPPAPASGWYVTMPTVSFTCDDPVSLVAFCSPATTLAEGADQTVVGTATNNAGLSATATVTDIDVDLTAPSISWSGGPVDGASYLSGSVPTAPTCVAVDALSGPASCTVTGYGVGVGTHTLIATAYDVAGNRTVESRSYTVTAFTLTGFYQPTDMGNVYNTVKAGSTVPLKWEIFAGTTELTDTSLVASVTSASVACGTYPEDLVEETITTTGGTVLRYDATSGQFIDNWATPKAAAGSCFRVTMRTIDGSSLTAFFKLR